MHLKFLTATVCLIFSTLASAQQVVPLWDKGAPGFESRRNEPEQAKDWWVKSIHNPSITAFLPPKEIANGAAIVVAPGGGHRELVFNAEGRDAALFLNKLGVAVFVLKYRLAREEGSPYRLDVHPRQDALRAVRLLRSRAKEWGVDPNRVGFLGFSAGGEVAALVSYAPGDGDANAPDPVDRLNGRPNFQMLVYPGPLGFPAVVPSGTPPTFMVVTNDDVGASNVVVKMIQAHRDAKVPVEAHLYARGGHAFNMGLRTELVTLKGWPQRLADWLTDNGFLKGG
jgi:acetyl esterase/lipase